jgi:hypothetical protein
VDAVFVVDLEVTEQCDDGAAIDKAENMEEVEFESHLRCLIWTLLGFSKTSLLWGCGGTF